MSVDLIPAPTTCVEGDGSFTFPAAGTELTIAAGAGAVEVAELLAEYLAVTGRLVRLVDGAATIALRLTGADDAASESYRLEITPSGISITAPRDAGLRHGVQTLRQLLPPEIYAVEPRPDVHWAAPCVVITDEPRFAWRGSLLDVGRYFFSLDYLRRYIEVLAQHKLNLFHLHLTEDQGWRFEVPRLPRLTQVGAWRRRSEVGAWGENTFDDVPHGGFYSQDELRELVAFAARRGVTIVPEIDLPGHTTAAIAAYPELGNSTDALEVSDHWGVHPTVLNLEPATLEFVRAVLSDLLDVFPSRWIHVGGDECPTDEWAASEAECRRASDLGLDGVERLQEWFTGQVCAFLREKGRTPVVWDEAATPGLPRDVIVMAWRDARLGFAAAQRGHEVVMAPMQATYFDFYQDDAADQPPAHEGMTPLRTVVDYDPAPPDLPAEASARILGTQGQLWTEYLPTPKRVDEMAFPRLSVLAERAWSQGPTDYADVVARLHTHAARLAAAGVDATPPP